MNKINLWDGIMISFIRDELAQNMPSAYGDDQLRKIAYKCACALARMFRSNESISPLLEGDSYREFLKEIYKSCYDRETVVDHTSGDDSGIILLALSIKDEFIVLQRILKENARNKLNIYNSLDVKIGVGITELTKKIEKLEVDIFNNNHSCPK